MTYDGDPHTATATATGVSDENLSAGLDLSGTTHTGANSYTDTWTYTDATGNYNDATGTVSDAIAQRALHVTATADDKVYDGSTAAVVRLSR